jgi:DNA-binding HxlR family transcriptional regulator
MREEEMSNQAYGQFCGLARALEVVGEPWSLMVVRDLVAGPKNFEELRHGLPGVPAEILSARLEELEQAGVVSRRWMSSRPSAAAGYELTAYGSELEEIVFRLGRWGAKKLGGPRRDEVVTPDSMLIAFRSLFRPEATHGMRLTYLVKMGNFAIHIRINDTSVDVRKGLAEDADLVIETGPALRALMAGEMSPREAVETGSVRLTGEPELLAWFVEIFHIPPAPPVQPVPKREHVTVSAGNPALNGHADPAGAFA